MTLLDHRTAHRPDAARVVPAGADAVEEARPVDPRVFAIQRLGACAVAATLLVFGLLGATTGVPLLATHGQRVLGLSSNGLLSALSLVVAVVLAGAAVRGPRVASTVMIVLGVLFLLSALVNMAVLRTRLNVLAFEMSNVLFSLVVGLLLLLLGCYGRVSGHLPDDSPYAHPHPGIVEPPELPGTPAEVAAEAAMRRAEIAVVEHRATQEERRRVAAMSRVRTRADRRRTWMSFDVPAE
jgi:Domain of unknown function (DUF4383)